MQKCIIRLMQYVFVYQIEMYKRKIFSKSDLNYLFEEIKENKKNIN